MKHVRVIISAKYDFSLTAIEIRSMRSNELWIDLYFFFRSYYFEK